MTNIRIRWKAILPAIGIIFGAIASPDFLALLPPKWARIVFAVSAFVAIFTPAVATNRPPSPKP